MNASFEKELVWGMLLWLRRWRCRLVFSLWFIALSCILPNGRYMLYLRPEFGIILLLALIVMAGFIVSDTFDRRHTGHRTGGILSSLIIILPLFFLLRAGDATLDGYAFQKRSLGAPALPRMQPSPESSQERQGAAVCNKAVDLANSGEQKAKPESLLKTDGLVSAGTETTPDKPADFPGERSRHRQNKRTAIAQKVSIVDLYSNTVLYQNKEVEFVGMVHHNEDVKKSFGMDTIVVFRFLVNCCAADAMPLAVVVKSFYGTTLKEGSWCKAQGVFMVEDKGDTKIPVLQEASIEDAKKPKQPYMF